MQESQFIWMNGEMVPWKDAKVHVLTHAMHYATAVFEGIRSYGIDGKAAIFRLDDHIKRLLESAKIYEMAIPYTFSEIKKAIKDTVKINELTDCYIRPLAYYGYGEMGISPLKNRVDLSIAAWKWGAYLGESAKSNGIRCMVSSWQRVNPLSIPPMAKAVGNYANSVLAKVEAQKTGFDEAIMLNMYGLVTEGTGENLFYVKDGELMTPPTTAGILRGITRDSVIRIANDLNIPFRKNNIAREELYIADELFLTGTAAEITPIVEVDRRIVGNGKIGSITKKIMNKFENIIHMKEINHYEWMEQID
ncbi:MAG: branched-chain amino acid transaminase [Candidatus Thermoplasmatota archaeon]|nr:branched-chain amino acid transaminase [Candidatus Thermoplasmatota archaeon]